MKFKPFQYTSLAEIEDESQRLGLDLHFSDRLELLAREVKIDTYTIPNSIAIHPMEGCDGEPDGGPGELTRRRYRRFAKSGAGLIWFEAVSVVPEGRVSPRQLWINEGNITAFKSLLDDIIHDAKERFGDHFQPACIMQLTHSGRFSKPDGKPGPILACHDPYLDEKFHIPEDYPVITDEELERLEDCFVKAAVLAQKAGFHGVDVKSCHRYLNSELLSSFTREGKYGGSFEGRTRFLLNIVNKIRQRLGDKFIVTTRMNIYDGIPYPYGWGTDRENCRQMDLSEPISLIGKLYSAGMRLINLTMGTPYYNPHVNRPYDKGTYEPDEHPLVGVARLTSGIGQIHRSFPDMAVVGTGYSWLRQFSPYLAAGSIEKGYASLIGYGREAFAYPEFASDILYKNAMDKGRCCIACSKCAEILRAGGTTGCVIRDSEVYGPVYSTYCKK